MVKWQNIRCFGKLLSSFGSFCTRYMRKRCGSEWQRTEKSNEPRPSTITIQKTERKQRTTTINDHYTEHRKKATNNDQPTTITIQNTERKLRSMTINDHYTENRKKATNNGHQRSLYRKQTESNDQRPSTITKNDLGLHLYRLRSYTYNIGG